MIPSGVPVWWDMDEPFPGGVETDGFVCFFLLILDRHSDIEKMKKVKAWR